MSRSSENLGGTGANAGVYDRLLDEYKEVGSNLRHYSNMRFERLNVFLIANGALSWAQLFKEPPHRLSWFFTRSRSFCRFNILDNGLSSGSILRAYT
jgi:hypothetical protein